MVSRPSVQLSMRCGTVEYRRTTTWLSAAYMLLSWVLGRRLWAYADDQQKAYIETRESEALATECALRELKHAPPAVLPKA